MDLYIVKERLRLMLWLVGFGFAGGLFFTVYAWMQIEPSGNGLERFLSSFVVAGALAIIEIFLLIRITVVRWALVPRIPRPLQRFNVTWWMVKCIFLCVFITIMGVVLHHHSGLLQNEFDLLKDGNLELLDERISANPQLLERCEKKSEKTLLEIAWGNGNVDAVDMLLSKGAEWKAAIRREDFAAVMFYNLPMIETLLRHGVDPNVPDAAGLSLLHYAAGTGNTNAVAVLLKSGGNVNVYDRSYQTPLQFAVLASDLLVIEMLVENGADLNLSDQSGDTALHKAVHQRNLEIARVLFDHGSDPSISNFRKVAPLHTAAFNGQVELVELLLKDPKILNLCDASNRMAFDYALQGHKYDVVRVLLKHGSDINRIVENQQTVLYLMIVAGDYKVARFLIEEGADVDIAGPGGETAHDFMRKKQLQDLLDLVDAKAEKAVETP